MKLAEIHEKPRERLIRYGVGALSDAELYALILTAGTSQLNVLNIAQRVSFFISSQKQTPTISQLKQLQGIGTARACQLLATIELGKRVRASNQIISTDKLASSAKNVFALYQNLFTHSFSEEFYVLFLDTKLNVIANEQLFVGTLDAVTVHPREIFHRAIKHLAHSVIIMHNHPSGDPTPSSADIIVTQTIQEVGNIVGIPLVDHIIFGSSSFWSWSDSKTEGALDCAGSRKRELSRPRKSNSEV